LTTGDRLFWPNPTTTGLLNNRFPVVGCSNMDHAGKSSQIFVVAV
jgi:hypothetical protein